MAKQPRSQRRLSVSIVGPGNLGTALALTLAPAGYDVKFIATRIGSTGKARAKSLARRVGARQMEAGKQPLESDVIWITVPDDAIADVARTLAKSQEWRGKVVFHSSGALTSDELAILRERGAVVASVHPMMTFVRGSLPEVAEVAFALEGDAAAVRTARSIVQNLGANAFVIKKQNKVLYHVFGSFVSPLVVALLASLEEVARASGLRPHDIKPVMMPLLRQTLRNYLESNAASAFSGPLVRGDVATVRKHLAELERLPHARAVYVALARSAMENLPVRNRDALKKVINESY